MKKIQGDKMTGYLWYSDQDHPTVYDGERVEQILNDEDNPFIIEGQLCDDKVSYSIKYVDGEYLVKSITLSELPKENVNDKYFQSHRMNGKILHFKEYWEEKTDDLCCGMKVLQPGKLVFVGFKK